MAFGGAGLAGLAGVPAGYTAGGLSWQQLKEAETQQAANVALGRTLQALTGGTAGMTGGPPPGGMPPGGGPAPGGLPPPPTMGGIPGPPGGGMPPRPPGGMPMGGYTPPPGFVNPSSMGGQPQNLTGPVIPPGGAGGPPMPGRPPASMAPPPPGVVGPPGGGAQPPMQQMDWRQVAQMVSQANPGAPPEVIAGAVTKALPLMNAESQQQWRMIQLQLQQERINQTQERLGETERTHRATEEGRAAGLEERQRQFDTREQRLNKALDFRMDTKATELQQKAEAARQKATSLQASTDVKARAAAIKEARDRYNDFDKHMRTKIQADTGLSGKEKKDAITQLDAGWAQHERDLTTINEQMPPAAPGLTGQQFNERFRGAPTGAAPAVAPGATPPGKYRNPTTGETGTWDGTTWKPD